jgi:DNA repair protein RecN (Recombination protein N)
MIRLLKISSLAVFDEVEMEFGNSLNCITGETGAGKSLILNALTLLMGARAGRDIVRPGGDRCVVEALFEADGGETVLRREVHASGLNRCYADGRLATVSQLAQAASRLVHIYGQHDYQDLLSPRQHMAILEDFSGLSRLGVESSYAAYSEALERLNGLEERIRALSGERDYMEHCLQELKSACIAEGAERGLEAELQVARRAAALKETALALQDIVYTGSPSLVDMASRANQMIHRMSRDDPALIGLEGRMEELGAALEDVYSTLCRRIESYEADPARVEDIALRLDRIRTLMRKHGTDEAGLIALEREYGEKLALLEDPVHDLDAARLAVEKALEGYASKLHAFLEARNRAAQVFCKAVTEDLEGLGMPGCTISIDQARPSDIEALPADGHSPAASPASLLKGEFLISTNVGQNLQPLAKTASGGELSRIMLAIKSRQNASTDATLIFDEIDAGIGGQTAFAIASKLREIASRAQTVVVTHLHQVASLADTHFVITKTTRAGRTSSRLKRLAGRDRIMELARMMGGDRPSPSVIEHARELVMGAEGRGRTQGP